MCLNLTAKLKESKSLRSFGIAFGSNLGNRLSNLRQAKRLLLNYSPEPEQSLFSAVFETAPVDCMAGTSSFLNAVGEIPLAVTLEVALELCTEIERKFGRSENRKKNSPRSIDLDIIYAGSLIRSTPKLQIPHLKLSQRRFVLEPLASIRPDLIPPSLTKTIDALLNDLKTDEPPLKKMLITW